MNNFFILGGIMLLFCSCNTEPIELIPNINSYDSYDAIKERVRTGEVVGYQVKDLKDSYMEVRGYQFEGYEGRLNITFCNDKLGMVSFLAYEKDSLFISNYENKIGLKLFNKFNYKGNKVVVALDSEIKPWTWSYGLFVSDKRLIKWDEELQTCKCK